MSKGILVVQAQPTGPERLGDFHQWYEEVHIPEMLRLAAFVSARRLAAEDGESFMTVYEVDDVAAAKSAMAEAQRSGAMTRPSGVQLDPPPLVRWFEVLSEMRS